MKKQIYSIWPFIVFIPLLLTLNAGCGGGGGGGDGDTPPAAALQSGVFVDSMVDGLWYETETRSGYTENGTFRYMPGETVGFYIGNLFIGEGVAKSKMSPIDLVAGAEDETNQTVTNICRLLQSIDYDWDPENGITITEEIADAVDDFPLNFYQSMNGFGSSDHVNNLINSLNSRSLYGPGVNGALVSSAQAQMHMASTLGEIPDGAVKTATGTYTYNSSTRMLTIHYTDSTFTGCGPRTSQPDQFEILSISSSQMVWDEDDGPMVWTRTAGTGNDLVGIWTFYDTDTENTYTANIGDDNSVMVIGYMVYCDEDLAGGTFQVPHKTITIDGNYSDWDTGDRVYLDQGGADCDNVPGLDLREVYLAQDSDYIYFRFVLNGPLNETFGYKFGEAFRHLLVNANPQIFYASAYYGPENLPGSFVHVDGNQFEAKFYKSDVKEYWIGEELDAWLDQGVATVCRDLVDLPQLLIDW